MHTCASKYRMQSVVRPQNFRNDKRYCQIWRYKPKVAYWAGKQAESLECHCLRTLGHRSLQELKDVEQQRQILENVTHDQ
jgi:hypothetical protein